MLTEEDVRGVVGIERQAPSAWSEKLIAEELSGMGRVVLVARAAGCLVGWCCCRVCGDEAELLKISVDCCHRRRGLGKTMLAVLEKRLREKLVETVYLEVRASNREAVCFYRATGWVEIGSRTAYYADPKEDALILSKAIHDQEGFCDANRTRS